MTKSLIASAEILCVQLAQSVTDSKSFKANPKSYIFELTNVAIGNELNVNVVENDGNMVNIVLPYYESVGMPASMGDDNLEQVVGGVSDPTQALSGYASAVIGPQGAGHFDDFFRNILTFATSAN